MTHIKVVDALPGAGKTSWIIDKLQREVADIDANATVYVAPLLSECDRIAEACPLAEFRQPQPVGGSKRSHLNDLLEGGHNIATTHKLFQLLDGQTKDILIENGDRYTLVIDEQLEVCSEYNDLPPADLAALSRSNMIYVDELGRLRWNNTEWGHYSGKFDEVKKLCDLGSLIKVDDKLLIWEIPSEFLTAFDEVIIMTYQFGGSLLDTYLRVNRLPYSKHSIKGGELVDYKHRDEGPAKEKLRELITVVDDERLNAIGRHKGGSHPLSATWFNNDKKHHSGKMTRRLQTNLNHYIRKDIKAKSGECMWACFKSEQQALAGRGYAKAHTAVNLMATNDYADRWALAFLVNVFQRPRLVRYFKTCGVEPDQDLYAVSQLIQWVFRSRIRNGQPITVYIPSERMRTLFLRWLNDELQTADAGVPLRAVA